MKVLGLTGPTGAGKGMVSDLFCRYYHIPSIDTDRVYHQLLVPPSPCLNELVSSFGMSILSLDGTLNRAALAKIVFADPTRAKQETLNQITHKYVLDRVRQMLANHQKNHLPAVLVDAPLLYESGFDRECDAVIAVLAPTETRKARIQSRDALSDERATARLQMQKPDQYYSERADYVLVNDGDIHLLESQVHALATKLGVSCI